MIKILFNFYQYFLLNGFDNYMISEIQKHLKRFLRKRLNIHNIQTKNI
jgi:hypothetical protein